MMLDDQTIAKVNAFADAYPEVFRGEGRDDVSWWYGISRFDLTRDGVRCACCGGRAVTTRRNPVPSLGDMALCAECAVKAEQALDRLAGVEVRP